MNIEIERKFLLKSLPLISPSQSVEIEQFYLKNSYGVWERARSWEVGGEIKYIHTIKKSISKGVNMEDERTMTLDEFNSFKSKCFDSRSDSKHIKKIRHIYPHDKLYWEVDQFLSGYNLVIAEIEVPEKTFKINIPQYMKDVILIEVTGIKQFSNRNLSLKINK